MAPCLEQNNQKSPTSTLDLNVPDIMSDTTNTAAGNEEDSIKAAVRDAAKKTQDRLAAYQQKQAAKAAAALDESQRATPSKAKQEADNTVSRLQQLVSESKRLTTKSRELNTQLPNVAVAAAANDGSSATNKAGSPAGGPGFQRSNTIGDPTSSRRQAAATSMNDSMSSSMRVTPKGKKLSEIFQNLGGVGGNASMSQSVHDNHSHSNLMERDNSVRSLMPNMESTMTQSSLAQWQHKREQQQKSEQDNSKKSKSKRGSQKDDDSDDSDGSSDTMDVDIDDEEDIDTDESESNSDSDHGDNNSKKKTGTKPQQERQPEDNGDFSILGMVQQKKKETEGREEVEEMIQEYYSTPAAAAGAGATEQQDEDPEMPGLDKILETPTLTRPKLNLNMSSNKKKRMPTRPQSKQEKAAATAEDNVEEDMPILAPFETPKANKPKFGTQDDDIPGMEKNMSQEEAESSMSLSMVFHKSSEKMEVANSPQNSQQNDKSPQPSPQAGATLKSALRRPSVEPPPPSKAPMNLSKLPLIGDNPNSRVTPDHDDGDDDDDDNKSTASSSPRHRRSTRTGRGRDDNNSSQGSLVSRSRPSRSKSRTRGVSRGSSLKGGSKGSKGDNVSLSILDKYHKKAADGSVQSNPDEVSVEEDPINNNDDTNKKTGLDISELSRSSESTRSSDSDERGIGLSRSMGDSSAESVDSSRTSGSTRRGRSKSNDNSTRRDPVRSRSRSRSRTRDVGRPAPTSRSVSRSASSRRGGRRQRRSQSGNIDGSMRDTSMRDTSMSGSSRRSLRINKDGNSSLREMSDSSRRRRSISTRRGAGRRGQRRRGSGEHEDETEGSTADEILGSLDVSDIKIVGDDDEEDDMDSSMMDDSYRASIYDRKQKRASAKTESLAGLSKLQSSGQGGGADDCEGSVSESVKSSASKKSMMGKFARKVGRKLTMQGGKKKKDTGASADDDEEEEDGTVGEEVQADLELQALAAEFDEEEKQIEASGSSEAPEMDLSKREQSRENGKTEVVDAPDFQKAKKKRQSTVFGAIKKVGSKITKKKKKKLKDTEALDSDSDSNDNDIPSSGTMDRSNDSDSEEDDDQGGGDFAQLQIDGDKASIAMCGSDRSEEAVRTAQPKGRQRRGTVSMRRQRADRQRTQSLQAVLGSTADNDSGDEDMDASVVTTDTKTQVRRAKSVRGRIQRTRASEVDVKRHKSLKGRMENHSEKPTTGRRIRRAKTSEYESNEEAPPPFDWKAYSAEKPDKRKSKEKRKSKADKVDNKRMSGGLSAVIYHGQTVAS